MAEPSGEKIAVSLIISTKNRARRLERCLKSTSEIAFDGSWELIVVDNASTDETPKIIEEARKSIRAPVIKLFESARGLGAARNRGIAVARGGIIAFTDDDCYVDRHYLTQIVRAFDDERVGYVTGRVELYDPTDAEVTIRRSLKAERYRARQYIHTDKIIGANLAFRRSVLRQIGGFDVHMGAGRLFPAEDVDAVARAARMGWEGLYCPEILVHHHHGRKINDVPKLLKAYDIGRGAYTVKYLLRGQFIPFLKGVASVRWRMGPIQSWRLHTFSMLLWEGYGAAAYLIVRAKELFVGKMQSDSPRMGSVSTSKPCTEWVNPPSIGAD